MITIVELPEYIKKSEKLFDQEERDALIRYLSLNPLAGALIKGTGGIRKIRWARKGMGKSGGYACFFVDSFWKKRKIQSNKS